MDNKVDKRATILLELADAAVVWWVGKRPLAMSLQKHLENPTLNTATDREKRLALAVAKWVRIQ